jgi:16S rRNA U1498 N3-methylase RsmE
MYFALIKKAKTRILLEKATELGAAQLTAVVTDRCQLAEGGGWDAEGDYSHVLVEATEQSERLHLPSLSAAPLALADLLQQWQAREDAYMASRSAVAGTGQKPSSAVEAAAEAPPRLFVCRERSETAPAQGHGLVPVSTAAGTAPLPQDAPNRASESTALRDKDGERERTAVTLPLLTALLQCPVDQLLWQRPHALLSPSAPARAHTHTHTGKERDATHTTHTTRTEGSSQTSATSAAAASDWLPPFGLLVGPEGGFTPAELDLCATHSVVTFVSLGRDVLRAETAGIAALATLAAAVNHCRETATRPLEGCEASTPQDRVDL